MIRVGTREAKTIELRLPWRGSWEAFASVEGAAPSGEVVIDWRGWRLLGGEVDPTRSGTFAGEGMVTVTGGLRWQTPLAPRLYTNDLGVLASTVALDLAATARLPLAVSAGADRNLGAYWPRRRETAGEALSRVLGLPWYVDLDGTTYARARVTPALGKSVAVLNYDPRDGVAELYADRPDQVPLAAVLPADGRRLLVARRVVELRITAAGNKERILAYTEPVVEPLTDGAGATTSAATPRAPVPA
jgi:hypothetical protein